MELHDRLKLAREQRGFESARDAADALGVPYGTYSGHENGSRGIRPESVFRYAQFFGVNVAWLEHGVGNENEDAKKRVAPASAQATTPHENVNVEQAMAVVEGALLSVGLKPEFLPELRQQIREYLQGPLVLLDPRSETDARRTLAWSRLSEFLRQHDALNRE